MTHSKSSVILITGASAGIGRVTAERLAAAGYRVFGTSRQPRGQEVAGVEMLELDVQADESVKGCVETLLTRTGRLDILINNAGYGLYGAAEETSLAEAKAQLETNFFGVLRVTNAALPAMREQKRGKIVNISSLAGVFSVPCHALYSASKFALEGYTEGLRYELAPFGIHVSLVQLSYTNTSFAASINYPENTLGVYDTMREKVTAYSLEALKNGDNPEDIAKVIVGIVDETNPKLRYRAGTQTAVLNLVRRLAPHALIERVMRRRYSL